MTQSDNGTTSTRVVTTSSAEQNNMMTSCMAGLGASELSMIHRLAGNDPEVRKRTIKKLRKWLLSLAMRLPDASMEECRAIIEPNFIRVWKALFYCMWMADKPLPQEQLAEQLSNFASLFKTKPAALLLFIEWFFRTIAREWPNIDRYRLDKFMMLIRRFLRSSLTQLHEQYKMRNEVLDPFLEIISTYVFNRFPSTLVTKKTRAQLKVPDPLHAPLGFQLHFVDIFMEELAKVCGDDLKYKKLRRILRPFICEMAENDDDRLVGEIKEKVFHYLMRQSDVALDFEEAKRARRLNNDEDDDDEEEEMEGDEAAEGNQDDKDLEEMVLDGSIRAAAKSQPLDPRAGAVDVILPQMEVDYADLAQRLTEVGGQKDVRGRNRKILYQLAKSFEKLVHEGEYPLGVPPDTSSAAEKRAIKKNIIKQATVRLLQLDKQLVDKAGGGVGKEEPSKKKKKKLKQKQMKEQETNAGTIDIDNDNATNISQNSSGGETSAYINDSELFDHLDDNYMSYLEEMHQEHESGTKPNQGKKKKKGKKQLNNQATSENSSEEPPAATMNGKKPKKRKMESNENETNSTDEADNSFASSSKKAKASRASLPLSSTPTTEVQEAVDTSTLKREKKKRRNSGRFPQNESLTSPPSSTIEKRSLSPNGAGASPTKAGTGISPPSIKLGGDFVLANSNLTTMNTSNSKMRTPVTNNNILTPVSGVLSSGLKKKVSFVMARNTEHPHADYAQSIQRSPAIPYDPDRQPNLGLLKSPATPLGGNNGNKLKGFRIPMRKRAAEYF